MKNKPWQGPKYRVLEVDLIKKQDREKVALAARFVNTGPEAEQLAGQEGFGYRKLDLKGRVGVLTYKGAEVALLFERRVTEVEPGPVDPVPESTVTDPEQVWVRMDLVELPKRVRAREGRAEQLQQEVLREQVMRNNALEQVEKANEQIQRLEKVVAKMEEKVREARKLVAQGA